MQNFQDLQRIVASVVARSVLDNARQAAAVAQSLIVSHVVVLHHIQRHVATEHELMRGVVQRESIAADTEVSLSRLEMSGAKSELLQMRDDSTTVECTAEETLKIVHLTHQIAAEIVEQRFALLSGVWTRWRDREDERLLKETILIKKLQTDWNA